MKAIKPSLGISLLLALGVANAPSVQAADTTTPASLKPAAPARPVTKKPVQQTLAGKVVAVDRNNRTVTLQVDNLTYVLQITDSTRLSRSDKEQSLADFVVGEEISVNVLLRELPNGRLEVAVLSVELPSATAAQGHHRSGDKGRDRDRGHMDHHPFDNHPNPHNTDGPTVSRHH